MGSSYNDGKTTGSAESEKTRNEDYLKAVSDAAGYIIFDNDQVVGFAQKPVFETGSVMKGNLKVCAVNRYGSLGLESAL